MKCIVCDRRKGKRFCPAKNTYICPQCCGEKRVVEINCPAGCVYLTSGQSYQSVKKYVAQLTHEDDPIRRRKLYETGQRFSDVLHEFEETIIRFTRGLGSFRDAAILEAVHLLQETYKTEEKGLIYEHTSSNPLVQSLARDLRKFFEEKRARINEDAPMLKRSEILDCLDVVEVDLRFHVENQSDRGTYLNFIIRNHPKVGSEATPSGLIYPT